MAVDQNLYSHAVNLLAGRTSWGGGGGGGGLSTCVNREQTFLRIPPKGVFQLPEAVLNSASKLKEVCGTPAWKWCSYYKLLSRWCMKRTGGFIGNAFLLSCQAIIEVPEDQYNSLHSMCVCYDVGVQT